MKQTKSKSTNIFYYPCFIRGRGRSEVVDTIDGSQLAPGEERGKVERAKEGD